MQPADPTAVTGSVRLRYQDDDMDTRAVEYKAMKQLTPRGENETFNLISSLCADGSHRPALDIDVPCHYVPSTTPGHGHLYFPSVKLDWFSYQELLTALAAAGIIERGFAKVSDKRGQSTLRPPGVVKPPVPAMARIRGWNAFNSEW